LIALELIVEGLPILTKKILFGFGMKNYLGEALSIVD
jgi:hypothetical protein